MFGDLGLACARAVVALNALWAAMGNPGEMFDFDLERFKGPWKGIRVGTHVRDTEREAWRLIDWGRSPRLHGAT